jgi:hypothetical protein
VVELGFRIVGASPLEHAATPIVCVHVIAESRAAVRAVVLRCLVVIDPGARAYDANEAAALERVLGPADRRATAPLVWAQLPQNLPGFEGELGFDLHLPCSLDLRAGGAAYLDAIEDGNVPLTVLFSGTAFVADDAGALSALPIPQTAEARFALPIAVCRDALSRHHGDATLVPVRREILARLRRFAAHRHERTPALDDAIENLLDLAEAAP